MTVEADEERRERGVTRRPSPSPSGQRVTLQGLRSSSCAVSVTRMRSRLHLSFTTCAARHLVSPADQLIRWSSSWVPDLLVISTTDLSVRWSSRSTCDFFSFRPSVVFSELVFLVFPCPRRPVISTTAFLFRGSSRLTCDLHPCDRRLPSSWNPSSSSSRIPVVWSSRRLLLLSRCHLDRLVIFLIT